MKKYNFNAGPCVLPRQAVESAIDAIRDFDNTGIGILEISHRTPGWERIMKETADLWKELLNIPDIIMFFFLVEVPVHSSLMFRPNWLKIKQPYLKQAHWPRKQLKKLKFK